MKIFKYTLNRNIIGKPQVIQMPRHGMFLHAQLINGQICMWFCITEDDKPIGVPFIVNYTGEELPTDSTYLATVVSHSNELVYHISAL
jgi:hypothetical protein